MRALLAEPDDATRRELEHALAARGWEVRHAGSAAQAVGAAVSGGYPLVVLAVDPDGADPLEGCRRIRAATPGRSPYLLLVTPADDPELVRELLEAGADDYLVRPIDPSRVAGRLALAEYHARRAAEQDHAARVQEASLDELFQSAPEGVAVVDADDRVIRINGEFTRMFGYTPEEALGRPINDLIVPEHLKTEGLRLTHGVVRGERIVLETVRRHKDGRLIDVSVLATPIQVGDGPIGAYGIYRDITERKAHERALRESEARYRSLFDQAPVGVFHCDARLRITRCNERLPEILREPARAIVGRYARELPNLERVSPGHPMVHEGPYSPPDGGPTLWISVRYAPLHGPEGELIGGMGVVEDITVRERTQQQLRAQAAELERVNAALRDRTLELEAAMQARSRLYSAINHELRTPISSITLYHDLLLSGTLGELQPDHADALRQSHTAALHLLDLVTDVLDLSKLEAGRLSVHPAPVSLGTLLRELRATAYPLVQQYGSELRLEIEEPDPPLVTDPQRLRQILLNLVSNAGKFGRGHPVVLRARADSGEVAVEVVDRGIGIAAEDLPRIFDEFVQVGSSHEGGTGLGLAICRRLAGLLGGRMEVESEPGVGSTFRVVLPLEVQAEVAPAEPTPPLGG